MFSERRRSVCDGVRSIRGFPLQDPGYSDTAIALANLEVVRAKRVLDHVQDYIAQKATDSSYGGQHASTLSLPPSTQVP